MEANRPLPTTTGGRPACLRCLSSQKVGRAPRSGARGPRPPAQVRPPIVVPELLCRIRRVHASVQLLAPLAGFTARMVQ